MARWIAAVTVLGWLVSFPILTWGRVPPADIILINGVIHTLDDRQPQATAVAVRRGRIAFVGDDDLRFATKDAGTLVAYLRANPDVTDVLHLGVASHNLFAALPLTMLPSR